jgi:amino acid adenylation domain-containing protein
MAIGRKTPHRFHFYLMYTSGSTGNPKGVFIPQEGILRLVLDPGYMALNDQTVMLNATSISFDTSAFEIWGALLNGGSLIVYADLFDGNAVAGLMRRHKVNTIWMTSGVLEVFVGSLQDALPDLRWLVAGGDIVPPKAVAKLYADNPNLQVVNGYGPTENSVYTCCHAIPRDLDTDRAIPIGKPINNTQVAVIDMAGQPAGIGIPGELLCMGGAVGLGYLNRDDLNAERFLPDPDRPGLLCYRSGDLVRWRPDGTIEFYGRLDNQLKIRGYRIEPAEIETALQRHPSVALGAITVHGEGASGRFLVAWVKPRPGHLLNIEALRTSLASELPEPSRPTHIRLIEEVPVTANGKIDRAALAKTFAFQREQGGYNQPLSPTGRKLAAIWSELLGIGTDIGPSESLFDLGGNSLLAVRLVSRINQNFGLSLTVRTVFEAPRFAGQVAALEAAQTASPGDVKTQRLTRLSQGSNQTWLAFPGIGATSAAFIGLAQAMSAAGLGDIVVFEPRGLATGEAPDQSIAAIAEEAAASWHRLSKAGPCRLLGHSFGGRLAFETALLLQAQGVEAPLTLLDSLPGNGLVDVSRIVADDSDDAIAEWLLSAMETPVAALPQAADAVAAIVEGGLVAAQQVSALLSLTRAQFAMNQDYSPSGRLNHGHVSLIHATQSLIGAHDAQAIIADLRRYCPEARAHSIEADHFSMLRAGTELAGLLAGTRG